MRIWLSVGGWDGSKQFEDIVYDTELKKELIRNLIRIW
jgi:GH18 family chitinase